MSRTLVVATGNAGKLREFRALLADWPLEIVGLRDLETPVELPDEGDEYRENALAKAVTVAARAGLPAIGDDSGLEVAGLGGRPGPHSARYGGPGLDDRGRAELLLSELGAEAGGREDARRARFVCWIALALPRSGSAPDETVALGECEGAIAESAYGDGGFGYDPVFVPDGYDCSMAELEAAEKDRISHRGRALRALTQTSSWARWLAT